MMKELVQNLISDLEKDNPGAEAVALYQNGETVLSKHFTPDRPRLIYSHTKSFVSTLAGMAIDEGKLTLDTTLCSLLPEYDRIITDEGVKTITLRHLLTMSSGFGGAFFINFGEIILFVIYLIVLLLNGTEGFDNRLCHRNLKVAVAL